MIPVTYNLRSILVRKASAATTAFGIALVVFVLASSQMLRESINRTLGSSGSSSNGFVLRKGSDAELNSSIENKLVGLVLAAPGVKKDAQGNPLGAGESVIVIALEKPGQEGKISNVTIRGVTDRVMQLRPGVRIVAGRPAQPGTDEVIIGARARGRFVGVELNDSFELKHNRFVTVVGVFEDGGSSFESEVWADIDTVRTSFGREGLVSSVTVQLESSSKFDAFEVAVESDKQLGLEVMRENDYYEAQSEGMSMFVGIMATIFTVLFALGAIIGAVITMYAAVAHRKREIGTLLALGFTRSSILVSFLFESVILSVIGGAIGALASLAMSFASFSMINMATWAEIVFAFEPTPRILLNALILGGVMGLLGGFFPALSAARLSPVNAMRD